MSTPPSTKLTKVATTVGKGTTTTPASKGATNRNRTKKNKNTTTTRKHTNANHPKKRKASTAPPRKRKRPAPINQLATTDTTADTGIGLAPIPETMLQARPSPGVTQPPWPANIPVKKHTMRNWMILFLVIAVISAVLAFGSGSSSNGTSPAPSPSGGDTPPSGSGPPAGPSNVSDTVFYIAWALFGVVVILSAWSFFLVVADTRAVFRQRRELEEDRRNGRDKEASEREVERLAKEFGVPKAVVREQLQAERVEAFRRRAQGLAPPDREPSTNEAQQEQEVASETLGEDDRGRITEQVAPPLGRFAGARGFFKRSAQHAADRARYGRDDADILRDKRMREANRRAPPGQERVEELEYPGTGEAEGEWAEIEAGLGGVTNERTYV